MIGTVTAIGTTGLSRAKVRLPESAVMVKNQLPVNIKFRRIIRGILEGKGGGLPVNNGGKKFFTSAAPEAHIRKGYGNPLFPWIKNFLVWEWKAWTGGYFRNRFGQPGGIGLT